MASAASRLVALLLISVFAAGCVVKPPARMGMVENPETGLQFGSVVDGSLVTDASFHKNKKIKLRTRNTSGDLSFDLGGFSDQLTRAYAAKGYEPTDHDDFGLMLDVNVRYSGQVQESLARLPHVGCRRRQRGRRREET
ncbi:MAG: complement resistance protein TraT [Rhodospirillales bacterium]|nr:complement resistance protein TraT [Rhodospirillales bacterium]